MNTCRAQRPLIISFLLFTIGKSLVKLLYSQIFLMIRQELELLVLYRNFVYFMLFSDIVRKYISLLYQSNESITNESTGQCLCTIALLYSIPDYQKKCWWCILWVAKPQRADPSLCVWWYFLSFSFFME